jgi:ABC-type thiamine transport system substrate-binding protein
MILHERKSKYKHKITVPRNSQHGHGMREWCEQSYGKGGRKQRWRFGWVQSDNTFYFKNGKDAMMFVLKWSV